MYYNWFVVYVEDMRPLTCEFCGKVDSAYRFKESKRFCSMACAKQYNANSARLKLPAKVASRKKTGDELNASRDSSTPADDVSEVRENQMWLIVLLFWFTAVVSTCSIKRVSMMCVQHTSESSEMQDVVMRSGTGTPLEAVPGAVSPPEHGSVGGSAESGLEDMDQSLQRKPVRQWTVSCRLAFACVRLKFQEI